MKRIVIEKITISLVLTIWYVFLPVVDYEANSLVAGEIWRHAAYMMSHANVWHLLGNLFVLWIMSNRLYLLPSVVMAFLCSFLPAFGFWGIGMTVGFSGVLFAIAGIKWGRYWRTSCEAGDIFGRCAFEEFCMKALPFAVVGIAIPHINWCIHLYCMLAGLVYGRYTGT